MFPSENSQTFKSYFKPTPNPATHWSWTITFKWEYNRNQCLTKTTKRKLVLMYNPLEAGSWSVQGNPWTQEFSCVSLLSAGITSGRLPYLVATILLPSETSKTSRSPRGIKYFKMIRGYLSQRENCSISLIQNLYYDIKTILSQSFNQLNCLM
jgi:hypothetical protein